MPASPMRRRSLSVPSDPSARDQLVHFIRHVGQRFSLLSLLTDAARPHVSWATNAFSGRHASWPMNHGPCLLSEIIPRDETRKPGPKPAAPLVYPTIPTSILSHDLPPFRATHQSLHSPGFASPRKCAIPRADPWVRQLSVGRSPSLAPHSELSKQQLYSRLVATYAQQSTPHVLIVQPLNTPRPRIDQGEMPSHSIILSEKIAPTHRNTPPLTITETVPTPTGTCPQQHNAPHNPSGAGPPSRCLTFGPSQSNHGPGRDRHRRSVVPIPPTSATAPISGLTHHIAPSSSYSACRYRRMSSPKAAGPIPRSAPKRASPGPASTSPAVVDLGVDSRPRCPTPMRPSWRLSQRQRPHRLRRPPGDEGFHCRARPACACATAHAPGWVTGAGNPGSSPSMPARHPALGHAYPEWPGLGVLCWETYETCASPPRAEPQQSARPATTIADGLPALASRPANRRAVAQPSRTTAARSERQPGSHFGKPRHHLSWRLSPPIDDICKFESGRAGSAGFGAGVLVAVPGPTGRAGGRARWARPAC
jgi:hypothetical protein